MKLRDYIEKAEEIKTRKELAEYLNVHPQALTSGKNGSAGLPVSACILLADLIKADEILVISASELLTEKKPERRAVFQKKLEAIAASVFFGLVISNMTPTTANALPIENPTGTHCILCQIMDIVISIG